MKKMKKELVDLLNIWAPSGEEHVVVKYAKPILEKLCDKVWLDEYGNLLAEKYVGDHKKGSTVILSAHMDSVRGLVKGRKVLYKDGKYYSSKGILGADDRAGMAIVLAALRNIEKTGFEGTIKVSFAREEEIGCVGSSRIDKYWIEESDLAIVVDRRGNNDIVVGNFSQAFCSNAVGDFLENCSALLDMDWKACEGGISDACTFAELGVHSVNLSAGYMNEHTDREYVVFEDMIKTTNLILQALALVNNFVHTFGEVPTDGNQWIDLSWGGSHHWGQGGWYDDEDNFEVWEGRDTFGNVESRMVDGNMCITQCSGKFTDELYISKETWDKIVQSYLAHPHRTKVITVDDLNSDDMPFHDGEFAVVDGKKVKL